MADIRKQMEDIIRQERGDIREKSASECRRESIQRAESLRATAENAKSDMSTGYEDEERKREREGESVEAERSGDIGEQTEAPMTEEERRRAVREKQNRNLVPTTRLSETERRELSRKGGLASAAARRRKKDIREVFDALLSSPATPEMQEKAAKLGFDAETVESIYDVLGVAMIDKALSGDGYCFQLVRDSAGDKPTDKSEVTASIMTEKDLEIMRNLEARIKAEKSAKDGQTRE